MKTYYIYHIPGIKIGCTSILKLRMQEQGFINWQVLETHQDIYIASDREIELQKEYGLQVDTIPYWQSVENRKKGQSNGGKTGGKIAGKIAGKKRRKLTFEQAEEIRRIYKYGGITQKKLSEYYGVNRPTISHIIRRHVYTEA